MIQSGAPGGHLTLDDPVRGTAAPLLLLVLLRMIQSGVSGHISPVNALVVLWPFLLLFPRMIQCRALHGLVSASLHYHGLNHHYGLLLFAASLLLLGLVLLAVAPHHHGLVLLFSTLHLHGLVLPMIALPLRGLVIISAFLLYLGLVLSAASLYHPGLTVWSVPLLHHGPFLLFAALRLLGLVPFSASLHVLGVVLCVASGLDFFSAPPRSRPPVSFASGRHFPPDAPVRGVGTPSC